MAGGSLHALVVGANAGVGYSFEGMSAFELIVILVLLFGGIGLAISAVRPTTSNGG
jgi:hypothetical protein